MFKLQNTLTTKWRFFFFQERINGNYGEVSTTAKTIDKTAERNLDYLMPSAGVSVIFEDGQEEAYLTIKLVDDEIMEMAESFTVVLSGVNGGAKLGGPIVMEVCYLPCFVMITGVKKQMVDC